MRLQQTSDGCDSPHLNDIDIVSADDTPEAGCVAGDPALSLRSISAVAILEGIGGAVKRVLGGGFARQHSAHHLSGSKLPMFDNSGGDAAGRPSRLLRIDLVSGGERRVFPLKGAFEARHGSLASPATSTSRPTEAARWPPSPRCPACSR